MSEVPRRERLRFENVTSIDFDKEKNKATFIMLGKPVAYEDAVRIRVETPSTIAWHKRPFPTIVFSKPAVCERTTFIEGEPEFTCRVGEELPPRGAGLETGRAGERRAGKPRTEEERRLRHWGQSR